MTRMVTLMAVLALAGAALSGCVKNDDDGKNPAPLRALATVSPLSPSVGDAVLFDASRSLEGGAQIATFAWNFGDGASGEGVSVTHAYELPGKYVVTLAVTDKSGASVTNDAALSYVDVAPAEIRFSDIDADTPPIAVIGASAQVVDVGAAVEFDGSASYGWVANEHFDDAGAVDGSNAPFMKDTTAISHYTWDFGDGSTVSGNATDAAKAEHAFGSPGTHPVRLTVEGANGATASALYTVYVPSAGASSAGGAKHPNIFTTATINGPQSLDPGFDYENAGGAIIQNVYETLVHYDRDNIARFRPVLAEEVPTVQNGGVSADGLTYTFKIRKNVQFHDGTPLDAEAVKFSIDRSILMNDPNSAAWISGGIRGAAEYMASDGTQADREAYWAANGVEVVDDHTVEIHLAKQDPAFLAKISYMQASIVSPTAFKAPHAERKSLWGVETTDDGLPPAATNGKPRVTRDPWADTHAVGTGAYKLRAWIPNDRVILDRYDPYWGAAPDMRTVVIQYVDDVNTRILMLLAGDADDAAIPANLVDKVQGKAGVRVTEVDSLVVGTIFFGQHVTKQENCPVDRATGEADCEALNDVHMRAAFTHAFDKDKYINDIAKNRAFPVASVIPKGMFGHDAELQPHGRDLEKARAELAKSRHPEGLTNVKLYTVKAATTSLAALELLKQNLAEIGIEAEVVGVTFPDLIAGFQENEFPIWILGWGPDYAYPDNYVVPYLDGRSGTYAMGAAYNDDAMNELIDRATGEPDVEKQLPIWREINEKAHEEYVHLWLSQSRNVHVERTWVTGYYYNPMEAGQPNVANYGAIGKA